MRKVPNLLLFYRYRPLRFRLTSRHLPLTAKRVRLLLTSVLLRRRALLVSWLRRLLIRLMIRLVNIPLLNLGSLVLVNYI